MAAEKMNAPICNRAMGDPARSGRNRAATTLQSTSRLKGRGNGKLDNERDFLQANLPGLVQSMVKHGQQVIRCVRHNFVIHDARPLAWFAPT